MIARRIREVRNALGKTQAAFGENLGVSRDVIANIENGRVEPTDLFLRSIIRDYRVSETWLRTGEGEMFRTRSRDEELAAFMGSITLRDYPDDEFKRRLLHVLSRMTTEEWRLLEELARRLVEEVEEMKKDRPE